MGGTLKDSFRSTLPTDRKNKNRRLIVCGFCVIVKAIIFSEIHAVKKEDTYERRDGTL